MSVQTATATNEDAARRRIGVTAALAALVVLLVLISLGIGPVRLSPVTVIEALFGGGSDVSQVIVREIRLPRTLLALAIGAILGLSGASLQGLLRNPLASPSLFGAPQSAAFGAVLVIALGLADVRSYALPVAAIIAAFGSVFVLLTIAGRNAGLLILILAGLAISSLAGAATALVMNLSSNPFVVLEIAFWLLGSLEDRSFQHVALALPFIVVGAIILFSQRNAFRALRSTTVITRPPSSSPSPSEPDTSAYLPSAVTASPTGPKFPVGMIASTAFSVMLLAGSSALATFTTVTVPA